MDDVADECRRRKKLAKPYLDEIKKLKICKYGKCKEEGNIVCQRCEKLVCWEHSELSDHSQGCSLCDCCWHELSHEEDEKHPHVNIWIPLCFLVLGFFLGMLLMK